MCQLRSNKKRHNLKSQAALEFLTVYAWAFLGLMITLGALYYYGIFDFSKYLPERCTFSSQMECLEFVMTATDVRIKLVNNLGETITAESMTITNKGNPPLSCSATIVSGLPLPLTGWETGRDTDFVFPGCSGGGYIPKERVEAKITLIYYAESTTGNPRHTITGNLQGSVN